MMRHFFIIALMLALPCASMAQAPQPGQPLQVIEITMPDGSKQQGVISDGKFIPTGPQQTPPPAAEPGQRPDAHVQVDQNQQVNSNNYNTNKTEHDRVDTVTKYGNLFLRGIRTFK